MTYYELLEIQETASDEVVRMAYKALAKKYHPDTYQGSKTNAEHMMKELNAAYETLSDPEKRKAYDKMLQENRRTTDPGKSKNQNDLNGSDKQPQQPPQKEATETQQSSNKGCSGCLSNILGILFWIIVISVVVRSCSGNETTNNSNHDQNNSPQVQDEWNDHDQNAIQPQKELSAQEKQIRGLYNEYYPVYILVSYAENLIFSKDVELNLYIDGEKVTELTQGDTEIYGLILPAGEHKLKISSSLLNSDSQKFTVGPDPYLGAVFNYLTVDVQFKNGNAEISELVGNTSGLSSSAIEANDNFSSMTLALALSPPKPIGDFDLITKQYKYRQLNTVTAVQHVSDTMDEWSWMQGAITLNLPQGATSEYLTVDELKESATSASATKFEQETFTARFTIGGVSLGTDVGSIQIFDLYTKIDIEEMTALSGSDSGQVIDNIRVEAVLCGDLQVYEVAYTITDAGGVRTGYSYSFFLDSVFGKIDIVSADPELLQTIVESIRIDGEYSPHVLSSEINLDKTVPDSDDTRSSDNLVGIFTQVGLYDHEAYAYLDPEYIPTIYLYHDGTFEFCCNMYSYMHTYTGGWYVAGEPELLEFHFLVDNEPSLPNLDFIISHNTRLCDADFHSDYDEMEPIFGVTSVDDILFHIDYWG